MRTIDPKWTVKNLPDLTGKTAIVTGANSGIGFHTALELGRAGAKVIAACRDSKRGGEAVAKLRELAPGATFSLELLDLADLGSVHAFADRLLASNLTLDLLVNNAGVMAMPTREVTAQGFERQFGTNHLGHFALTMRLLPALKRSKAPRVVSLSSGMAYIGKFDETNLQSQRRYSPSGTYSNTKLSNLHFMLELGRRAPWLTSVAAHPGATNTNLQVHGGFWTKTFMRLVGQSADAGALPTLYAAAGEVASGEFYGPRHLMGLNGPPKQARLPRLAKDVEAARKLWEISEQLTQTRLEQKALAA